ncbi:MDR family MFS transporter [Pseudonocardia bannensis]|uniref:MDR family MFS transporter n=1 Tax=Pseudonocardia bannensis TaxID=630973 RepID=UPI001B7CECD8|nr:MDR family MFS transporter [Pseudonocardia bannensis]
MSAPAAADSGPAESSLGHKQILTIFAGLMVGMFLAALDQTIVATSIRTIADDLDGLSLQAWATTAYLITATITTPLYGKLSDLYGRKPLFLTAIGIFVVGSVACTFATTMYQLAAFRALQGLGAGGLFSLALTIIGDIVAPRERARYQGYFVAVFGTSSVLGPVAGGFFAGRAELLGIAGWRWVFLINVPLGILALFVVSKVLNIPHTRRDHRIDWPGALALAVGLVPLLIVAEQGRTWGWVSGPSVTCFVIGAIGLLAFLLAERRIGDDALLPLRFFRSGVFSWGSGAAFIAGLGMFGGIALLPLYLQIVKGATPTEAGLLTLPLVLGIMSMSIFSGQLISRTGRYKVWPIIGITLMIVGLLLFTRVGVDTPFWQTAVYMVVFGWGLGGNMQPLTLAVQNAMPPKDMGVATASATFFRQMGGTLGTAVFLSILFSTLPGRIADNFRAAAGDPGFRAALADPTVTSDPANEPVLGALRGGTPVPLDDSSFLSAVDPRLARPILEGFAGSMSLVFLTGAAVLVSGLVCVIAMKEVPLRTQSGVDARRAADPLESLDPSAVPVTVPEQAGAAPEPARRVEPAEWPAGPARTPVDGPPHDPITTGDGNGLAPRADGDARDRLLALLLPDPQRAIAVIGEAERAREGIRRARRELAARTAELADAAEQLVAQGLSPAQVERLLGPVEQVPDRQPGADRPRETHGTGIE